MITKGNISFTWLDNMTKARIETDPETAIKMLATDDMYEALLDTWEVLAYWLVNFEDEDHKALCDSTREKIEGAKQALAKADSR